MPSLSHKRLHGRARMLRALTAAGQFAHVNPSDIGEHLDDLYNINVRLALGATGPHELAAPLTLVKAHESRLLMRQAYDARTVDFLAYIEGVCCCLCLGVSRPVGGAGIYSVPKGFVMHVCPTFLRAEGRERFDDQPPLCIPCRQALGNKLWRDNGIYHPHDTPALWSALLAWLAANRTFRDRVVANAGNAGRLRFDPRRIPERAAA